MGLIPDRTRGRALILVMLAVFAGFMKEKCGELGDGRGTRMQSIGTGQELGISS